MLGIIQLLCGILYATVLCGVLAGSLLKERKPGRERYIRIRNASSAEQEIFFARAGLSVDERLVLCLSAEQLYNLELQYIVTRMQRRDPAMRIVWNQEKEARAG